VTADFPANSENISVVRKNPAILTILRANSRSNSKMLDTDSLHVTEQRIIFAGTAKRFAGTAKSRENSLSGWFHRICSFRAGEKPSRMQRRERPL